MLPADMWNAATEFGWCMEYSCYALGVGICTYIWDTYADFVVCCNLHNGHRWRSLPPCECSEDTLYKIIQHIGNTRCE